jgi:hypothetical protein
MSNWKERSKVITDDSSDSKASSWKDRSSVFSDTATRGPAIQDDIELVETVGDTIRGAAQGATFGFADEIEGGLGAAGDVLMGRSTLENIMDSYRANRDASRQQYDIAAERSPTATTLGNIGGGILSGIATAGLGGAGAAANTAGTLQKILNASKVGAAGGAVAGVGTSEGDLTKGELGRVAADTVDSTLAGAVIGGGLQGAVQAGKAGLGAAKDAIDFVSDFDLVKRNRDMFKLGWQKQSAVTESGLDELNKNADDVTRSLTEKIRLGIKQAGDNIEEAENLGKSKGVKFNFEEQIGQLKEQIETLKNLDDPTAAKNAKILEDYLDNLLKGKEEIVPVQYSKYTPEKKVEATPSARQKLEAEAEKLTENARIKGENARFNIQESEDGKFISLVRTSDEPISNAERAVKAPDSFTTKQVPNEKVLIVKDNTPKAKERLQLKLIELKKKNPDKTYELRHDKNEGVYEIVDTSPKTVVDEVIPGEISLDRNPEGSYKTNLNVKTVDNTPGTPETRIPAQRGPIVEETASRRVGGINPKEVEFQKALEIKDTLNKYSGTSRGAPMLDDQGAINTVKQVTGQIDEQLKQSTEELRGANNQYQAMSQIFEILGIKPKDYVKDPVTGELKKLKVRAVNKVENAIKNVAVENKSGRSAAQKVDEVLKRLELVDPEGAKQLRGQIQTVSRNLDLADQARKFNIANPATWLKSGTLKLSNVGGLGARKVSDVVGGGLKSISDATPQQLKSITQDLVRAGGKKLKLVQPLMDAMKKDSVGRNAAIFALLQNPEYREILDEYIDVNQSGKTDDTE